MATEPAANTNDPKPASSARSKGIESLNSYLTPALAGLLFTFVVLRVLVVARFDRTTALGIVSEGGTAPLVVGTMLYSYPLASIVCLLVTLALHATGRINRAVFRIACTSLLILFTVSGPVVVALLNIGLIPLLLVLLKRQRAKADQDSGSGRQLSRTDKIALAYVLLALPLVVLVAGPWMPAERIAAQGQPAVTGYVLKSSPESTVVLLNHPRRLARLEGKVSRQFCVRRLREWYYGSVPEVVLSQADYPRCKDIKP